jgi:hypothetical protein
MAKIARRKGQGRLGAEVSADVPASLAIFRKLAHDVKAV